MRVVVTSGYFDCLHVGHIELFARAKIGNLLVVIVNNEKQAILKKGKEFMPCKERCVIISKLKDVDLVFESIDEDLSVCKTLQSIRNEFPNCDLIFAKGGDWNKDNVREKEVCERLNIKVC